MLIIWLSTVVKMDQNAKQILSTVSCPLKHCFYFAIELFLTFIGDTSMPVHAEACYLHMYVPYAI